MTKSLKVWWFKINIMKITSETKYMDLLNQYPLLKRDLGRKNPKFEFLVTPMGKITLWDADLSEVSKHCEMDINETVKLFNELVSSY